MVILTNYKYYKWIALIPGWFIGDFVGAIASFFLVKEIMSSKKEDLSFEIALIKICSLLIKADGNIDKNEVEIVRGFFIKTYGKSKAERLFKESKESNFSSLPLDGLISVLTNKTSPTTYYSIIQLMYSIAASDGVITASEDNFIIMVGSKLNLSEGILRAIRNQFIQGYNSSSTSKKYNQKTMNYLNVLGLKGGESREEIKAAYRSLAKEFHPDKLNGVSMGIQNLAKEKFQLIQEAYEYLNKYYE